MNEVKEVEGVNEVDEWSRSRVVLVPEAGVELVPATLTFLSVICLIRQRSQTFGSTDMPIRNRWSESSPRLRRMRTGRRCATLTIALAAVAAAEAWAASTLLARGTVSMLSPGNCEAGTPRRRGKAREEDNAKMRTTRRWAETARECSIEETLKKARGCDLAGMSRSAQHPTGRRRSGGGGIGLGPGGLRIFRSR
jgi:hypothetical protein